MIDQIQELLIINNHDNNNNNNVLAPPPPPSVSDPRAISREFFSAAMGSVCCCYAGQPFDTVKVRMQTDPMKYRTVFRSVASIYGNEGITAFWKGGVPTVMGMVVDNAMAFGVNEALKRAFPDENNNTNEKSGGPPSLLRPFVMGAITGCFAAFDAPAEVIKCKLQVVEGTNDTVHHIISQMIKRQGYTSFLCGIDGQIARDASFYAVFFGGYEMSCYLFRTYVPSMPEELNYFLSGGLAGMIGWTVSMPFDVPKTNVQASYETKVIGSYIPEFIRIYKQRGIGGFYSGLGPTILRAFPANAALFLGVEMSRKTFDNYIWRQ